MGAESPADGGDDEGDLHSVDGGDAASGGEGGAPAGAIFSVALCTSQHVSCTLILFLFTCFSVLSSSVVPLSGTSHCMLSLSGELVICEAHVNPERFPITVAYRRLPSVLWQMFP